jgi:hypothetical protein
MGRMSIQATDRRSDIGGCRIAGRTRIRSGIPQDHDDGWYIADSFELANLASHRIGRTTLTKKNFNKYPNHRRQSLKSKQASNVGEEFGWIATSSIPTSHQSNWLNNAVRI